MKDAFCILFIRHGKTAGNERRAYIGTTDEPLSGTGREELLLRKRAGEYPAEEQVKRVFISPMLRCRQSAALLYPGAELIEIPEWTEIAFGDFEGKNYRELDGDPAYQAWIDSGGTTPFPNGESRERFAERVLRGLERMKTYLGQGDAGSQEALRNRQKPTDSDPEIPEAQDRQEVAVVHGGTVMALFSALCGGDYYDYRLENGAQRLWKGCL